MKIRTSICFLFFNMLIVYQKPGEIMEVLILIKLTARFDCCELTLGFNAQKIVEIVDLCINFFK